MQSLIISKTEAGQRLDKYLQKYLSLAPKGFLYKMMRKKNIVLNGKKADGSEKICEGDEIRLYLADDTILKFTRRETTAPYRELPVVYEDDQVLIVNKPVGMLSQKAGKDDVSLNEYVIGYLLHSGQLTQTSLKTFRPGVCNRLDRNTSGLVLAGKTVSALQKMSELLRNRTVHKYYLTLVHGQVKQGAHICGYLYKEEATNTVAVYPEMRPNASYIETAYEPIAVGKNVTLLKVLLITGKTHQIRSHLASCGHSIVGDMKYGDFSKNKGYRERYGLKHQLLHAWKLEFPVLEEEFADLSNRTVTAPVPELFSQILKTEQLEGVENL